jgi:methionyl-tRNA synthetase
VFGQDADFTDETILGRYNADLANDLGNLVSRATTMIHRHGQPWLQSSSTKLSLRESQAFEGRGAIVPAVRSHPDWSSHLENRRGSITPEETPSS